MNTERARNSWTISYLFQFQDEGEEEEESDDDNEGSEDEDEEAEAENENEENKEPSDEFKKQLENAMGGNESDADSIDMDDLDDEAIAKLDTALGQVFRTLAGKHN